ncbi:MAG: UDP-N-acetylenolpyruvoylglucosamine reductase [Candidatus Doudnabacteria bacterium RIFCSPLOWO2_02_FULL_49_13]|uniref:UDP-N-acetylenolpyruvoylglucosamine reductase n=1 Tax=Candidatus Doudnabacteria bacterium RIFCSPHIGHO2_12_FULL_48_16 TaxID=1817838 RepID=A0A1F5PJW5_9BACT|nr:MAG: UDP-N-acetylenolpyruvoylglucosamine reductase [Candidatus Doudnabacteria bacterium RIFCSPHIGHO2_02_FULL_49_24]OGE89347.1 MAG: UDP-N-acetylenolpyruvoylglucosamine reductase [Candidatus Doudnabacteria bacterium RIFCSPHIGHO2_01_FULL_50_67]OGE89962.1 MAG: UDP-N-acetylenolpyruvoylglucosamine reductase [Candidatus Doudnabacteria bacterium RIFCSPHIGHO2_12_FULL_48_16]OGE97493.1 MAG: UDP-N-acetylenolpyruvoylglucosamine reductase [Candidatus Doudnabacteria bacterium RIFCSPLOWO2_01_FULL_49_40]OGF0
MEIKEKFNLDQVTTFRIGGPADFYCVVQTLEELKEALKFARGKDLAVFILAGGSNLLFADAGFRGMVINIAIKGIEILHDDDNRVEIRVGSGEVWDDIAALCALKELWGIENLSGIPGRSGAIPIQNVGAYGQEASRVVSSVEVLDLEELEIQIFNNDQCGFEYRQSNFNTIWKNKYAILSVTFTLARQPKPNLSYIDLSNYFAGANNPSPGLPEIRQAVIAIRSKKFPDLNEFGCAGSCFKNLILTPQNYLRLEQTLGRNFSPEIVSRLQELKLRFAEEKRIKIPAAFLVDICGLKGQSIGAARLWKNQALVIVNTGSAKARDVAGLFKLVRQEVFAKTGMRLVSEPEWVGFSEQELAKYFEIPNDKS